MKNGENGENGRIVELVEVINESTEDLSVNPQVLFHLPHGLTLEQAQTEFRALNNISPPLDDARVQHLWRQDRHEHVKRTRTESQCNEEMETPTEHDSVFAHLKWLILPVVTASIGVVFRWRRPNDTVLGASVANWSLFLTIIVVLRPVLRFIAWGLKPIVRRTVSPAKAYYYSSGIPLPSSSILTLRDSVPAAVKPCMGYCHACDVEHII